MRIENLIKNSFSVPEAFVDELLNQYSGELPKLLSYFPPAQMNPFQQLLYRNANDFNYMIIPFTHIESLGYIHWGGRSVIHLHWLAHVLRGIDSVKEGQSRISTFIGMIKKWQDSGNKVIWTMHNLIPHNATHHDLEYYFREQLVNNIDAVHIMNKDSIKKAEPYYHLPTEKIFYVPHVSFNGYYPNVVKKNAARAHLMLEPSVFYFLFFGALSPYKKIDKLIDAMTILSQDYPQLRLIIAGFSSNKNYDQEISSFVATTQNILIFQRKIQDSEIQYFMNACDAVILPYNTLNSGVAAVAAAFHKHCIGPKLSGVSCIFGEDYRLLFDDTNDISLLDIMKYAVSYVRTTDCNICYEPESSISFFEEIEKIL